MKRPLIPIVICYALGLLAAHYEIIALRSVFILCGFSLVFFLAAVIAGKRVPAAILALVLSLLLGFLMLYPLTPAPLLSSDIVKFTGSKRVNVEGVIDSTPVVTDARTRLYIAVTNIHEKERSYAVSGRLLLSIKKAGTSFHYGDRIRFFCTLKLPRNFQNPGGFDYVRYLASWGYA